MVEGDGWAGSVGGKGGSRVWSRGVRLEKMGEWNRKDCGKAQCVKNAGCSFERSDQASSDLSGTSDETVKIITNITPTGASEYTVDIFSS